MKEWGSFVLTVSAVNLPLFLVLLFIHVAHMSYYLFNNILKFYSIPLTATQQQQQQQQQRYKAKAFVQGIYKTN